MPRNNRPLKRAMGQKPWDTTLVTKHFRKYRHHGYLCNNYIKNWSIRIPYRDLWAQK